MISPYIIYPYMWYKRNFIHKDEFQQRHTLHGVKDLIRDGILDVTFWTYALSKYHVCWLFEIANVTQCL